MNLDSLNKHNVNNVSVASGAGSQVAPEPTDEAGNNASFLSATDLPLLGLQEIDSVTGEEVFGRVDSNAADLPSPPFDGQVRAGNDASTLSTSLDKSSPPNEASTLLLPSDGPGSAPSSAM